MLSNTKIGVLLVFMILFTSFATYFWQIAKAPNLQVEDSAPPFALYVGTNGTYKDVLDSLYKYRVVNDKMSFQFLARFLDLKEQLKPGRYVIRPKAGNLEVIQKLRKGLQDPVPLTFNNIRLKADLIKRVGNKFAFGPKALGALLNDSATCQKFGFDTTTVVSMFLPNTYDVMWTTSPDKLLGRMHDEYKKFWTPGRTAKATAQGLSPVQVSVMASIVDAETNQEDEMPRVAGVYLNRLRQNMPLQADPTVIFATGDFSIKRVTGRILGLNSPYNTYRNTGLPPGPINLPSLAALDAVLNAENHKYLYFCVRLTTDGGFTGYHDFAESYADHQNNARLYQEALNKRNIQ